MVGGSCRPNTEAAAVVRAHLPQQWGLPGVALACHAYHGKSYQACLLPGPIQEPGMCGWWLLGMVASLKRARVPGAGAGLLAKPAAAAQPTTSAATSASVRRLCHCANQPCLEQD